MEMVGELKPIGPFVKGMIVGYVDKPEPLQNFCAVGNWYAVNTEPKHESLAMAEIASRGLVTYLPVIPREENHGRGRTRFCERPMFPTYVFVCCMLTADDFSHITCSRGVHRLIGTDGKPMAIPHGAMEIVRKEEARQVQREGARLARTWAKHSANTKSGLVWDFSPDELVRISQGPFAGFNAQLETAVDDNDRIKALVGVFSRQSSIELSAFDIEKL